MTQPIPKPPPSPAVQVVSELLAAAARERFGGSLQGKLVLAGSLAALGAAQPLAATLQGAAFLGIEPDPEQIKAAMKSGYCEIMVNSLDEALRILKNSVRRREPASVGLIGDCALVVPELARRGVLPDIVLLGPTLLRESPGVPELHNLGALLIDTAGAGATP